MHARTAILVGATGLVGRELLAQLLADSRIAGVTVLTRRATGTIHPRLHEHIVDFDRPDTWASLVTGDLLLSALGTTVKAAGSQFSTNFRAVRLLYGPVFSQNSFV